TERAARSAHPTANPNSTIAVAKSASTAGHGMKGRRTAAARPTPNESTMIFPMPMRFVRGSADRAWSSVAPVLLDLIQLLNPVLPIAAPSRQPQHAPSGVGLVARSG